jgi:ubiquinone/menaquinone biosynthesis C-methylase UbiE
MQQEWDRFWSRVETEKNLLSKLQSFYRTRVISMAVNFYINRYFRSEGVFIECGAGTSETTIRTKKGNRKFIALDYSALILKKTAANPKIDACINADIFSLPFKDKSVDGIWNVGVMEHFTREDIDKILSEFSRVLKEDGYIILFWPMVYSPYEIIINIVEFIINKFTKKHFQVYPDEVSRLSSRGQAEMILKKNNFKNPETFFNYRDAFSFAVVIGRK